MEVATLSLVVAEEGDAWRCPLPYDRLPRRLDALGAFVTGGVDGGGYGDHLENPFGGGLEQGAQEGRVAFGVEPGREGVRIKK